MGFIVVQFFWLMVSQLTLKHTTISNSPGHGLLAFAVEGLSSITDSKFTSNRASSNYRGGNALFLYSGCKGSSHLLVNGSQFFNGYENHREFVSSGTGGLTVQINCMNICVTVINTLFDNNQAYFGGGLYILFEMLTNNSVKVTDVVLSNGRGERGSGLFVRLEETLTANDPFSCKNNHDVYEPHNLMELTRVSFLSNTGIGALCIEERQKAGCAIQYVLIKDSVFSSNLLANGWWIGTAVRFANCPACVKSYKPFYMIQATFQNVSFLSNGVQVLFQSSSLYFQFVQNVTFINCTFENNSQAAITSLSSNLIFQGRNIFRNNSAALGGALTLLGNSFLYLMQETNIWFVDNHAQYVGGAIFIDPDILSPSHPVCFFQIIPDGPANDPVSTISVNFLNNSAGYAGSSIYGGHIHHCTPIKWEKSGEDVFRKIFNITNSEEDPSAITSDPLNACLCSSGRRQPNCSIHNYPVEKFPGEDFTLRLAVVGDTFDGVVPGAVHASFYKSATINATFGPLQRSQTADKTYCSNFTYTIFSTNNTVSFYVTSEKITFIPQIYSPKITVHLKPCPLGFTLSHDTGKCECASMFHRNGIHCYISNQSILRPANSWIGFVSSNVLFHDNCPYGYCLSYDVYITTNLTDEQCEANRTGFLCGKCAEGYSLTLGYQECAKCSNVFLLLIFPLAIVGILLVALLFAFKLTVTDGSINGLIFYSNVVGMSHYTLSPSTSSSLYIFISWLNLDLGINTCFFDGMDAYTETWLQFVFPVYLWAIIIIIIVLCNKFPKLMSKFGGQDSVKVLATLLLLSYTKLQQTLVTIFSFTTLKYSNGVVRYVWLYDANVEFLDEKHLLLLIVGIFVLIILVVPYTVGLASFQYLQTCSGRRIFRWVNKMKPVFDAYAGPYKDRYRTWTGILLIIRTLLIIAFTLNITGLPDLNLLIILAMSLLLLMASSHGIYNKWQYNILESFFYLQLGVLAGGLLYARHNNGSVKAMANFSMGLTLVVFSGLTCHRIFFSCCASSLKRLYYKQQQGFDGDTGEEEPLLVDVRSRCQERNSSTTLQYMS